MTKKIVELSGKFRLVSKNKDSIKRMDDIILGRDKEFELSDVDEIIPMNKRIQSENDFESTWALTSHDHKKQIYDTRSCYNGDSGVEHQFDKYGVFDRCDVIYNGEI